MIIIKINVALLYWQLIKILRSLQVKFIYNVPLLQSVVQKNHPVSHPPQYPESLKVNYNIFLLKLFNLFYIYLGWFLTERGPTHWIEHKKLIESISRRAKVIVPEGALSGALG